MICENKKPTEIYCVEDLFKYCLFGCGDVLYIANIIPPQIVVWFLELLDFDLIVVYFDYCEYDSEFAKTHVRDRCLQIRQ